MKYDEYLQSERWQKKRQEAPKFWGYKCALCYSSEKLHVHHRTYYRLGNELPTDVIVLCSSCHDRHHEVLKVDEKLRGFWMKVYSELEAEGVNLWRQCPG